MERGVLGVELACSDMWSKESKYTGEEEIKQNARMDVTLFLPFC